MESGKPRLVIKKTLLAALAIVAVLAATAYQAALKAAVTACHSIMLIAETTLDGRALTQVGAVTADVSPTRT